MTIFDQMGYLSFLILLFNLVYSYVVSSKKGQEKRRRLERQVP